MDTEKFRQSLELKWLEYNRDNRSWIVHLGIWITSQGQRRPSLSFILATLAILEPKLNQLMPLNGRSQQQSRSDCGCSGT